MLWAVFSDGKALDPAATYTVAANDFMYVGGDGYTSLTKMTEVVSREQLWEVAANYVKSLGTVNPQIEGRVVAAVEGQPAPTPPVAVTPVLPTPASILPTAPPAPSAPTAAATATTPAVQPQPTQVTQPTQAVQPTQVTTPVTPGMPTTGSTPDTGWLWTTILLALTALLMGVLLLRRKALR